VNAHYAEFLGLGTSLKGGDEKVEELKLGLLSFQREVEGSRRIVAAREAEVEALLEERKAVRRDIAFGRRLVDWEGRLSRLEGRLAVESTGKMQLGKEESDSSEDDDGDEEEEEEESDENEGPSGGVSSTKLRRRVHDFLLIRQTEEHIGSEHPFVVAQRARIMRVRNTLLLDLGTALKQAKGARDDARTIQVVNMYGDMNAAKKAVEVLKGLRG